MNYERLNYERLSYEWLNYMNTPECIKKIQKTNVSSSTVLYLALCDEAELYEAELCEAELFKAEL